MGLVSIELGARKRPQTSSVRDFFGRPLRSLRVSVTDRCNLRCTYCMPEEAYSWLPQDHLLSFEELAQLVGVFASLGVRRVRFTGGEPMLRPDIDWLVRLVAANPLIEDLALTTNGTLPAEQAALLRRAGLHRITVSLDTLGPDRFRALTRRDQHRQVLDGIAAVRDAGFVGTKIDAVVIRGINDDELSDLIEFGRANDAEVRFIEYMDVPGATQWTMEDVVSRAEIPARLEKRYGSVTAVADEEFAPASRFLLTDGTMFGIVASTTAPFCARCDRSRLTADGMWYCCLYAPEGADLRRFLRSDASPDEIARRISDLVAEVWGVRDDRGAERRKANDVRSAFVPLGELWHDPHFEMHTRGG